MRVEWISEEEKDLIGYGLKKKGDRFDVPDPLGEQLISQGICKDAYVTKEDKKRRKNKVKGDK